MSYYETYMNNFTNWKLQSINWLDKRTRKKREERKNECERGSERKIEKERDIPVSLR